MAWVKKALLVLLVGFIVFYLISQPEAAADAVQTAAGAVALAFRSVVRFFTSLAG